jgi:hypothetical protein
MKTFNTSLTARGLGHISDNAHRKDFEFVVDGRVYHVSSFLADFLSPKIARVHHNDPTFDRYVIVDVKDPGGCFEAFLSLAHGCEIEVNERNRSFLADVSKDLENRELHVQVAFGELSLGNVHKRVRMKEDYELNADEEIKFLAAHFHELSDTTLEELSLDNFYNILGHPDLKLDSEDALYSFISRRFEVDESYVGLLEFVRFEFLTTEVIERFIETIPRFIDVMNMAVWTRVFRRLVLAGDIRMKPQDRTRYSGPLKSEFGLRDEAPLDGIIAYLTRKCGGNVHDKGVITVTGSGTHEDKPERGPKNAADLEEDSFFWAHNSANQWLSYDFKSMRVLPSHYTIRSCYCGSPSGTWNGHLKSWVIEISDDGFTWKEVDRKTDNSDLNSKNAIHSYKLSGTDECRFIRLRATGKNHGASNDFCVSSWEIFGELYE